jgi:imidazole glycerol phosphate synthase glutamine amidotransferase subunit
MIGIVDIGIGNAKSIYNALCFMGIPSSLITKTELLANASKLILPGVGNFANYMTVLRSSGYADAIYSKITTTSTPLLGICVGAQALLSQSLEGEGVAGLDLIKGEVVRITQTLTQRAPNVGWRKIEYRKQLFTNSRSNPIERYYFSHNYQMNVAENNIVAVVSENIEITTIVKKKNIIGVQFHPEKSNKFGLSFLKSFCEWVP